MFEDLLLYFVFSRQSALTQWFKLYLGPKLKNFRTDNARDYFSQMLYTYFTSQGIIHGSSCVNTPPTKLGPLMAQYLGYLGAQPLSMFMNNINCIFLGYSPTQKVYKCYNPSPKKLVYICKCNFLSAQTFLLQGEISMIEDNPCACFKLQAPMSTPSKVLNSKEAPNFVVENSKETPNSIVEIS
ncbi:hypothetical protein CR513_37365, partial [Mucuna pruriens]